MTKAEDTLRGAASEASAPAARTSSKIDTVLNMLEAEYGATLPELVSATGWQPHTARAVLSGLKKKGHTVEREKADGVSRYRIVQAADQ